MIDSMKNLIGVWPNLSRACEIAMVGGFSVQVVFGKEYTAGQDDYQLIKEFWKDVQFSSTGDLIVEINKPDSILSENRSESIEDVMVRVNIVKQSDSFLKNTIKLDKSSCDTLMRTAKRVLNLSVNDELLIDKIAEVISKIDLLRNIETQHFAEAIQYRCFQPDLHINAESATICFGKISIPLTEIDYQDIEAAINYLQSIK